MRTQAAQQFFQAGNIDTARALCQQALNADPQDRAALHLLVKIYRRLNEIPQLLDTLYALQKLEPDNVAVLGEIGRVHQGAGRFDEAQQAYRQTIALQPGHVRAFYNLAMITKLATDGPEVTALQALHARSLPDSEERKLLAFALGRTWNNAGDVDQAFGYFREANAIAFRAANYSHESAEQVFARIRTVFTPEFLEKHQQVADDTRQPIFVSGLPRSGTTLVEQILASHPEVFGGGELRDLYDAVTQLAKTSTVGLPDVFLQATDDDLRSITATYRKSLENMAPDSSHVTDKSIANFRYFALIATLMPNAPLIYCRRDPLDQGLSIFQLDLQEQPYGYDLAAIGRTWLLCEELLQHWNRLLPGKILTVQYEDLVTDPENQVRRLLEHCHLDFDPACLAFHETDRVVRTASEAQVRKPLYTDSIGRWRRYEKHLGPLLAAVGRGAATH